MRTRLKFNFIVNPFPLLLSLVLLSSIATGQNQLGNTVLENVLKGGVIKNKSRVTMSFSADSTNGIKAGKILFYDLDGPNWVESGPTLYGNPYEEIGHSYDLSDDGSILVSRIFNTGHLKVHKNINNNWVQMGQTFTGQQPTDTLGAFAISSDGYRIAISITNRVLPGPDGIVQVYDWDGNQWQQVGSDVSATSPDVTHIGWRMTMSGDGQSFAIVGKEPVLIDGELFLFRWDNTLSDWVSNGRILGVVDGEQFGQNVAMSNDGSIVAYTIPGDGGPVSAPTGSMRVLKQASPGSPWIQQGNVIWGSTGNGYGEQFDLSRDGRRVMWRGKEDINHPPNCGSIRAYEFNGTNWDLIFEKYGAENESLASRSLSFNDKGTIISTLSSVTNDSSVFKAFGLATVKGSFFYDLDQNCAKGTTETGIPNQIGLIQPGNYTVQTDSAGFWSINILPDGNYTITADTSGLWTSTCPVTQNFSVVAGSPTLIVPPIGISSKANQTDGNISVVMPIIKPCTNQNIYINVCNSTAATTSIDSGSVVINIDPTLTVLGMSLPYTTLGSNQFLVALDTISPGECIQFTVNADVSCSAVLGESVCIETELTPNDYCYPEPIPNAVLPTTSLVTPCLTAYDGSNLEVNGYCQNDSIYFEITNTAALGNDMTCYRPVVVFKDGIWVHADSVQLNAQQTYTLAFEGNGESWHIATYQHPLHPIISNPNVTVENCGGATLPSLASTFDNDDFRPCKDIFCDVVKGPFDPNDKRGYPMGFTSNKYVFPNGQMQYVARFENIGNDTAQTVIIRDTIDTDLDIFSLRIGPASHEFEYSIIGLHTIEVIFPNIRLPGNITNPDESHGFFSFTINQLPNLAPGTPIHNSAAIYFDNNPPVITNKTERIVYYLLEHRAIVNSCDSYTWIDGITYTQSNDTASTFFQNSLGLDSLVYLDLTIHSQSTSTDVVYACDNYTWIDGITYYTNNNTASYTYTGGSYFGCDSTVFLDLTLGTEKSSTDVIVQCEPYTWIDGVTYNASNTTASFVFLGIGPGACDSTVYLNLTVLNEAYEYDILTACTSYTWINGVTYTSSNNTAFLTYPGGAFNGCDSTVFLDLTIETVDVGASRIGNMLVANLAGASYQWLDCNNNFAPIVGETNQSFTPTQNGSYAVEITEYNCTDTSSCISFLRTDSKEIESLEGLNVYPNPTTGTINIELGLQLENVHVQVTNLVGQLISEYFEESTDFVSLEIEGPNGIYFIKIKTNNGDSGWIKMNKIN